MDGKINNYQKGEIQVSFALTNQTGKVAKSLAVEVEGQAEPVVLTVVADIPAAWTLEPLHLRWDVGEAVVAKTLVVKAAEGETLQIEKIFPSRADVKVETKMITPGKHYELLVTPKSTETVQLSTLTIETSLPYPLQKKKTMTVGILPKKQVEPLGKAVEKSGSNSNPEPKN
jgi:hypothetical protein